MDRIQQKLDEFFNTASAVQVEEGMWYFHESSVESELSKVYQEIETLRAENEALRINQNAIRAQAVRDALAYRSYEAYTGNCIIHFAYEYANKIERGEA